MQKLITAAATVALDEVRLDTLDDREHLVFPAVAIREGVLNDALVPADEIERSTLSWNGRPVPIGHPRVDPTGTANTPAQWDKTNVGQLFNVTFADKALKGEVWLDILRVQDVLGFKALGETPQDKFISFFGNPEDNLLEVSTAYFPDVEMRPGIWDDGKRFTEIHHNLKPDHFALLPGQKGACDAQMGCGAPRLNQGQVDNVKLAQAIQVLAKALAGAE